MSNENIDKNHIDGGAFLIARRSFESELWRKKPAEWWKVWCFILGSVQHTKYKELERGWGFFNLSRLSRENGFGNGVTENQVEKFFIYAKQAGMIATQKATQGVVIKVLNYNLYQNLGNYKAVPKAEEEAEPKRSESDNINKNGKNEKKKKQIENKQSAVKKANLPVTEEAIPPNWHCLSCRMKKPKLQGTHVDSWRDMPSTMEIKAWNHAHPEEALPL